MSKFQQKYNQAKTKAQRVAVPAIKDQIQELETQMRQAQDPDLKKGIKARIDALKIKMDSYRKGDPVKEDKEFDEEAQGGVTTASIGTSTMSTNTGETEPAIWGSSHIHAKKVGPVATRKGDIKKKPKKKKKKKNCKEFVDYYFED